jgi:hypothetical protein
MARLRKKKISWERPDSSRGLRYRLYWSVGESVGYDSQFIELENVTEITLPDDVAPFPIKSRNIQIGISAINQAGNESDIARLDVLLDFSVPGPPKNLRVVDLGAAPSPKKLLKVTLASLGIILLTGIGVLALLTLNGKVLDHLTKPRQNDHAVVTNDRGEAQEEKPPTTEVPNPPVSPERRSPDTQDKSDIDTVPSDLNVEAIVWSSDKANSFAFINGSEVRVGDYIEGATVTEIGKDYVAFKAGDSRFRVTMR